LFLKKYLPLIDILDQSQPSTHELSALVKPGAPFISNGSTAIPFEQVLGMLKMREGMLSFFTHGTEDIAVFDLEIEGGGRKVVCEADSMCVYSFFFSYPFLAIALMSSFEELGHMLRK
jgi:hypothetical protein